MVVLQRRQRESERGRKGERQRKRRRYCKGRSSTDADSCQTIVVQLIPIVYMDIIIYYKRKNLMK